MSSNFVLHCDIQIKPERREDFISKFKEIAEHARLHEPECLAFHLSEDPAKPNSFGLFEMYSNKAAWEVSHMASKPSQEMYAMWPHITSRSDMRCLTDTKLGFIKDAHHQ